MGAIRSVNSQGQALEGSVFKSKGRVPVECQYNESERRFELLNCTTGEIKELYSIEKYTFAKSDEGDDLFDASLR